MKFSMTAITCGLFNLLLYNASLVPTAKAQDLAAGVQANGNNEHRGDHACSLDTLRGRYGALYNGTVPGVGPIAGISQFKYDGEGHLTQVDTFNLNGNLIAQRRNETGTYTVNSDCSGSQVIVFSDGGVLHQDIVIVNHGREVFGIATDPGYTVTFDSKKQ